MIQAEFKINNKKYGDTVKRMDYQDWMEDLTKGNLVEVDFPQDGILWECTIDDIHNVSNGKVIVLVFEMTGIRSGISGKPESLEGFSQLETVS